MLHTRAGTSEHKWDSQVLRRDNKAQPTCVLATSNGKLFALLCQAPRIILQKPVANVG